MDRIKRNRILIPAIIATLICFEAKAQDDLLQMLQTESTPSKENVIATFKGDKIINVETNETVRKDNLDFRISHLFGNVGTESGGGVHNFWGIDQSADIRLAFHYGISDRLMIGVSHVKRNEIFEGLAKFRALQQTSDNSMPIAVTLYGNMTYSIKYLPENYSEVYRLTYCSQAIIARKFSSNFSMLIIPGLLHRNFVEANDQNNTFSLSGGFRYKFTRSTSLILDYAHTFGREEVMTKYYDVLGLGIEVETGGHVFSIMFTNGSGVLENDYLVNTMDSWAKGGMKFSFIISRMFGVKSDEITPKIKQ